MLILRKGKKIINKYSSAYELADDTEMLMKICGGGAGAASIFLKKNAFAFAIAGSKARLGNGYIVEARKGA